MILDLFKSIFISHQYLLLPVLVSARVIPILEKYLCLASSTILEPSEIICCFSSCLSVGQPFQKKGHVGVLFYKKKQFILFYGLCHPGGLAGHYRSLFNGNQVSTYVDDFSQQIHLSAKSLN